MNLWRVWVYRIGKRRWEAPDSAVWLACAWSKEQARGKVCADIEAMGYKPDTYRIGRTIRFELGAYDAHPIEYLD